MAEALELGQRGRGRVEPNPRVGALALQGGAVVGRGYHAAYGGAHAEVVALKDAEGRGARPDTMVVTLEPCSSKRGQGGKKTPPCTEAIVRAGIKKVIIGRPDPDPRHTTRGEAQLRQAGIEVQTRVLEAECRAANRPFQAWLELDVPWMVAKWAMSLDGKTATRGGDSKWISGEEARRDVHRTRAQVDAVMVGYKTAVKDDPELTVRMVEGDNPLRLVVDPLAALPTDLKLVRTAREVPTRVLVGPAADPARIAALELAGVQIQQVGGNARSRRLDLEGAFRALRAEGMRRVLMEGGGALTARLLEDRLVHQVTAYVAAKLIGGREASSPVGGEGAPDMGAVWNFGEMFCEALGEDVVVHAFAV